MELKEYFEQSDKISYCVLKTKEYGTLEMHLFPPMKRRNKNSWILVVNGYLLLEFKKKDVVLVREFMEVLGEESPMVLQKDDILPYVRTSIERASQILTDDISDELEHTLAEIVDGILKKASGIKTNTSLHEVSDVFFSQALVRPYTVKLMLNHESDFKTIKHYISKLREEKIPRVVFSTTECLNDRTFYSLVEDSRWFSTVLETDASLLTPIVCQDLASADINSVLVSLSSLDYGTEFHISGGNPKDKLQGIKNALKNDLSVTVMTKITSDNTDYLVLVKSLHKLGVRHFIVSLDENVEEKDIILKRAYFYTKINELELTLNSFGVIPGKQLKRMKINRPIVEDCLTSFIVGNDGGVYPNEKQEKCLGSLSNQTFLDIWESKEVKEIRRNSLLRSKYEKFKG